MNGRIKFILKQNPNKLILHTVQVELNGFIQGMVSGTLNEGIGYTYYGARAYTDLVQSATVLPKILSIPLEFLPHKSTLVGHMLKSFFGVSREFSFSKLAIMGGYVLIIYLLFLKRRNLQTKKNS